MINRIFVIFDVKQSVYYSEDLYPRTWFNHISMATHFDSENECLRKIESKPSIFDPAVYEIKSYVKVT